MKRKDDHGTIFILVVNLSKANKAEFNPEWCSNNLGFQNFPISRNSALQL